MDPSSLANVADVTTRSFHLDWRLDFDTQKIYGSVTHTMEVLADKGLQSIALDTRALDVSAVHIAASTTPSETDFVAYPFTLEPETALGQRMNIALPTAAAMAKGTTFTLRIAYTTTAACTALCWLSKEQTDGGTQPYVFSQCQPIHARSMFPCQDSPSVRSKYTADVVAPAGITVLMSALEAKGPTKADGATVYHFTQPVAMASYLVAVAAGDLAGRDISKRCRVWCEPAKVDACAAEFSDTERFVATAEDIAGPYEWTRYDLLVLPASFPYGGMENPCLTFVTPSIVVGDKSMVDVVAHEIAHSWSGNLVGVASWEHFFLNEGFTMFLQRKIMTAVHNKQYSDFEASIGWSHLKEDIERMGVDHKFTRLNPPLNPDTDPDDAFSTVPYEKGYLLLHSLESLVGERAFGQWLRDYFAKFRHQSISTDQMIGFFTESFPTAAEKVQWDAWRHNPGMPDYIPSFDTTVQVECTGMADAWLAGTRKPAPDGWLPLHRIAFIQSLVQQSAPKLPAQDLLMQIEKSFQFTNCPNNDVRLEWFDVCTRAGLRDHLPAMTTMLKGIGRMKYIRPLYRAWFAVDAPAAKALFAECRGRYHSIAQKMLDRDLQM